MTSLDPADSEKKGAGSGADALRRVKVAISAVEGMSIDQLLDELDDDFDDDFDDVGETSVKPIGENESQPENKAATPSSDEMKDETKSTGETQRQNGGSMQLDTTMKHERRRRLTDKVGKLHPSFCPKMDHPASL